MVMVRRDGVKAGLKIAQAGLTRELGIDHHHEMLESGKPLAPLVTAMRCNKLGDPAAGKALYDLLEKAYGHCRVRF